MYSSAAFWAMLASIFFWPEAGILWRGKDSGSLLGIQLLGYATMSVWAMMIVWLYFFTLKKLKVFKLKKAEEILGMDAIDEARTKNKNIAPLLEAIKRKYPDQLKKGC